MSKKIPERRTKPCQHCKKSKVKCVYADTLPCERCLKNKLECSFDGPISDSHGVNLPLISNLSLPLLPHTFHFPSTLLPPVKTPTPVQMQGQPSLVLMSNQNLILIPTQRNLVLIPTQQNPGLKSNQVQPNLISLPPSRNSSLPSSRNHSIQNHLPHIPVPLTTPHPTPLPNSLPNSLQHALPSQRVPAYDSDVWKHEVERKLDTFNDKIDDLVGIIRLQQQQMALFQAEQQRISLETVDQPRLSPKRRLEPQPTLTEEEEASIDTLFSKFSAMNKKKRKISNGNAIKADVDLEPGLLKLLEAQELFTFFDKHITPQLFGFQIRNYAGRTAILDTWDSCPLLIVSICYIASIHHPSLSSRSCGLLAKLEILAGRLMYEMPTLEVNIFDTILALCLSSFWLSQKRMFVGIALQLANLMELNVNTTDGGTSFPGISKILPGKRLNGARITKKDKLKLWYLLYILDGHQSLMTHKQPLIDSNDLTLMGSQNLLLSSTETQIEENTTENTRVEASDAYFDLRLVSQVEYNQAIHSIFTKKGRTSWNHLLDPAKFGFPARSNLDLDAWMVKWTVDLKSNSSGHVWSSKSTLLYYHFAKMYINSPDFQEETSPNPDTLLKADDSDDEEDMLIGFNSGISKETASELGEHISLSSAKLVINTVCGDKDILTALKYVPVHIYVMVYYAASLLLNPSAEQKEKLILSETEQQEYFQSLKSIKLLLKVMEQNQPVDEALGKQLVDTLQDLFNNRMVELEKQLMDHANSAKVEEIISDNDFSDHDVKLKIVAWPGYDHGHP
ncbi:hypothetical protein BABINDRAFT_161804 [Babjeviella inositovora NRRL Y-12698]|uniref:Zn(2)-C6 fungal-type domain-containing protein n=1 Tax=Babjeviella inositovora NRRL Y-12698 TaxID=984486 RepID=A0A1E3QNZ9_9ASCO|nr:uncharacterized protein BABINDRAFT_161804 [Babjeviella inositovora NRRL Y-12698]ODQ79401.1 hypothetical protein BABINDRAFT_161804 [Babjeviella inositovora NRRL Y-12698]